MAGKSTDCDVAIIGAGHNGLACAAYLAKAGLKAKVFERRRVVGGAAVTEAFHPGFRNSVCSYTVSLLDPKVIRELELHRRGLRIVAPKVPGLMPLPDGDRLVTYAEPRERKAEIARHSRRDAEALDDYEATIERLADALRALVRETPPNAGGGLVDLLRALKVGNRFRKRGLPELRDLADILVMSEADFLDRWFENEAVKAHFAFSGIVGTLASPYHPGTAYVLLHHAWGEVNGKRGAWGHVIGGMGAISEAIAAAAREAGAAIETNAPVKEVVVEKDKAAGVALEDGRVIRARAVAANVNPKLLFGRLVDDGLLAPEFRKRMKNYRTVSGSFRMNVALSELPRFACLSDDEREACMTGSIYISPSMAYMDEAWRDARFRGWSRKPAVEIMVPSLVDDTLAPPGAHVASLFCQHFNPDLPDGRSWDEARDEAAETVIDTVTAYAPNFRSAIIGRQVLSPLDLEREFGLTGGDIFHGALDLNQIYSLRPTLGYADYRMPIKGLYLCGSGAHPGGGVTAVPGHNAAREIVADLKRWFR